MARQKVVFTPAVPDRVPTLTEVTTWLATAAEAAGGKYSTATHCDLPCDALQCSAVINLMNRQLTIRLPDDLADKLERAARRARRRRSEVVRLALEQYLEGTGKDRPDRPIDLVRDLVGSWESGIPDLGQRHRDYLMNRLRRGRSSRS